MNYKRFAILATTLVAIFVVPGLVIIAIESINPVFFYEVFSFTDTWLTGIPRDYNNMDPNSPDMICSDDGKTCWANPATFPWTLIIILLCVFPAFFFVLLRGSSWAFAIPTTRGIEPVSKDELRSRLLGLNDEKIPFEIIADKKNPNKIIARWKIADSKWLQIFSANRLTIYYELRMLLVDRGSKGKFVNAQDYFREVEYSIGIDGLNPPKIRFLHNFNLLKGIIPFYYDRRMLYGLLYKDGQFKVDYAYNFRFVSSEIKTAIVIIITKSGWDFRPSIFLFR